MTNGMAHFLANELSKIGFRAKASADNSVEVHGNTLFATKSGINYVFNGLVEKPEFTFNSTSYGTLISWG